MIAYFDSSAFVPLILDEPSSEYARRLWLQVDRVASTRLLYVESRAALARAHRHAGTVFVAGDRALCEAARQTGLQVSQL